MSCAIARAPQPSMRAAVSTPVSRTASISPSCTRPGGVCAATARRNWPGSGCSPSRRAAAATAAATVTATPPAMPSGWAWVTSAARAPWVAACTSESACQAPSGAARMAAPLPDDPWPSNAAAAAIGHGRPSRIWRSSTTAPGP